ncbi:hypothetical protein I552_2537 [Mycobacterium xenopi 3993]|nr:hypothetical protein I552_2537 [Mycobacterium xenopi 3993]
MMVTDLAASRVWLDTNAVIPAARSPVTILVNGPIAVHFTAVVSGRARSLIVTFAVPAGNAPVEARRATMSKRQHPPRPGKLSTH